MKKEDAEALKKKLEAGELLGPSAVVIVTCSQAVWLQSYGLVIALLDAPCTFQMHVSPTNALPLAYKSP